MASSTTASEEELALQTGQDDSLARTGQAGTLQGESATASHVADFYHRYPGEVVTFYTCVGVQGPVPDLTLRILIPAGLELADYDPPLEQVARSPSLQTDGQSQVLVWPLVGDLKPGARYEFQTRARVLPLMSNAILESNAVLLSSEHRVLAEESASVAAWARGRYLRFLPELYEQDELMGRFLMLFESFWAPIEVQIGAIPHYLEPRTTPKRFMPWLAGWLGLQLDDRLSEEQQRTLIRSAIWLYRRRGTKQALQKYLQLYTGGQVQIIEHRAMDFRLGAEGRLGSGVALGRGNRPHTFTVHVTLPAGSLSGETAGDSNRRSRVRRMIESVIEAEKPAHTGYTLILEGEA